MSTTVVTLDLVETSALIGAVLPVAAAVVKQDHLSRRTNAVLAVAVAFAVALGIVVVRNELDVGTLAASFTAAFTTAVAFYHGLWKPTGIASTVQTRTSLRRKPTPPPPPPPPRPTVHHTTRRDRPADLSRC
jgi:hypothetical protein